VCTLMSLFALTNVQAGEAEFIDPSQFRRKPSSLPSSAHRGEFGDLLTRKTATTTPSATATTVNDAATDAFAAAAATANATGRPVVAFSLSKVLFLPFYPSSCLQRKATVTWKPGPKSNNIPVPPFIPTPALAPTPTHPKCTLPPPLPPHALQAPPSVDASKRADFQTEAELAATAHFQAQRQVPISPLHFLSHSLFSVSVLISFVFINAPSPKHTLRFSRCVCMCLCVVALFMCSSHCPRLVTL
jgi:hypothetical protein